MTFDFTMEDWRWDTSKRMALMRNCCSTGRRGIEEEARLRPNIGESGGYGADEITSDNTGWSSKESIADCLISLLGRSSVESIGGICGCIERNIVLTSAVSIIIVDCNTGPIDGKLLKIWSSVTIELCIQVGKDAPLEKWIFSKVNAPNNVTRLKLLDVRL